MATISENDYTIFHAADAGGLVEAAEETMTALRNHGFDDHATKIERSMSRFIDGASMVQIKTLREWHRLFDEAFGLLCDSPINDPGIADLTADLAGGYVWRELLALGADEDLMA